MPEVFDIILVEHTNCDEITGYILTYSNGARLFHHTLEEALTRLATDLTGKPQIVMVL